MKFKSFSWILSKAVALVAPQYCVICSGPIAVPLPWPLCSRCALGLTIHEGRRCSCCGKPIVSELGKCLRCRAASFSFDGVFPLYTYAGIVRKLLIAYKAKKRWTLALYLAQELAREINGRFQGYTIVPIPPRPGKIHREGWDQVDVLARLLEQRWKLPVVRLLVRLKGGDEQKSLNRAGRRTNVLGRYTLIVSREGKRKIQRRTTVPEHILLLDDIMTTGATLSECASILKQHGCGKVFAIVLAAD